MNGSQALEYTQRQADEQALKAAMLCAYARSFHSYFNQYILTDFERGYIVVDEGDYGALPQHLVDRIVDSVPSQMLDEF
jgi:predicted RNase H-like nuclease